MIARGGRGGVQNNERSRVIPNVFHTTLLPVDVLLVHACNRPSSRVFFHARISLVLVRIARVHVRKEGCLCGCT